MSEELTEAAVRERLDEIVDPCSEANGSDLSIVEMGLLDGIETDDGHVHVDLLVTSPHCMMAPVFVKEIDEKVGGLPGVDSTSVDTDAGMQWKPDMITEEGERKREQARSYPRPATAQNPD